MTENGQIYDRNTGTFKQMFKVKWGNWGGIAGNETLKMFVAHCGDNYGSRVYDYMGEDHTVAGYSCPWWHYTDDNQNSPNALGYYNGKLEDGRSSQMAMDAEGKVYTFIKMEQTGSPIRRCSTAMTSTNILRITPRPPSLNGQPG